MAKLARLLDRRIPLFALLLLAVVALFLLMHLEPLPEPPVPVPAPLIVVNPQPSAPASNVVLPPPTLTDSSHAFVFYATTPGYACGALLLIRQLATLSPGVPSILMVPPQISRHALVPFSKYNTTILTITPPKPAPNGIKYYRNSLLKLMAFSLHQRLPHLKRIIVLDADQTVRKPLHPLFDLPRMDIAAPLAYWEDPASQFTSTLLVISLSDRLWDEVSEGIKSIKEKEYDMDLLNRLFYPHRALILPGAYCTINSHWEVNDLPSWIQNKRAGLKGLWEDEAVVIHFTAGGKPWGRYRGKPEADKSLISMFADWKEEAGAQCAPGWDIPWRP